MPSRLTLACLCSLILLASGAWAQVYRWQDEQGRVHLGDRPPAGVQATLVSARSTQAPAPADDEAARERDRRQQEAWRAVMRRLSESIAPTAAAQATAKRVPRGVRTEQAPQGNCAYYRDMFRHVQAGGKLEGCGSFGRCAIAGDYELDLLQREMNAACAKP